MRDNHCIFCKAILRGRATGRNEYIRHNGGLIHTACMEPYKIKLSEYYCANSRVPKDPAKRKRWNGSYYQRHKDRINLNRRNKYAMMYKEAYE